MLAKEYEHLITNLYPALNYVQIAIAPSGGDFALWAQHSFLTTLSFDLGPPRASSPTVGR